MNTKYIVRENSGLQILETQGGVSQTEIGISKRGNSNFTFPKLPDIVIEETRQIYNEDEHQQWKLADHLVGVIDELGNQYVFAVEGAWAGEDERGARRAMKEARSYILRSLANSIGADITTMIDRESMGRFFDPTAREQFYPLTYHQLRACKSAGKDHWREYAEWALDNLPCPVHVIRAKIKADKNLSPPLWQARLYHLRSLARAIHDDEGTPHALRQMCLEFWKQSDKFT